MVSSARPVHLFDVVRALNLPGLQACYDARDISSYPGTGITLFDVSGSGYDFTFGDGATPTTYPAFTGTAGMPSAYLAGTSTGGYLTGASANPSWVEDIHKDNASFSLVALVAPASYAAPQTIASTQIGTTSAGFRFIIGTSALQFGVGNGAGAALALTSSTAHGSPARAIFAVSVDEAAATGFLAVNSTITSFTSTYLSPSAGSAANTIQQMVRSNINQPFLNGSGNIGFVGFAPALTQAQYQLLFQYLRQPFGI